ncbi:porin [Limnohabitans sp. JirII-29]|uniref:porin n=1 Tax=Limnohabitans sp. JirII-29 TaxID=1835756 RepID=UPI001304EF08|nr:porin [Limnohabitans sp. JirII-29]
MKKTLVALAALAATASFAQSFVTLSGRASMDVSTYEATGSTIGATNDYRSRVRVADTSSRITFAAQEDLGAGSRAGVYCETGINIDNAKATGQADNANANTSEWCSREGRLYYGNNTAEIRLGRQNVWWTQGALNQVGSRHMGSDSITNLQNGGVGVYGVRLENMVMVNFNSGLGAFAGSQVYAGRMGTTTGEGAAANTNTNGQYAGGKLMYTAGQIVGMVDYQTSHNSATATGVSSFDRSATKLGLGYKYAGAASSSIVSAQVWNKKRTDLSGVATLKLSGGGAQTAVLSTDTANTGSGKDSGYAFNVEHDLGANRMLVAQYGKANNLKNASGAEQDGTGATAYTIGFRQALSKRTHVYAAYHTIKNDANINYNMSGGNYASAAAVGNGAQVKIMALGMQHDF